MEKIWSTIMNLQEAGKNEAIGVANTLDLDDIETIIATIDYFGGEYKQDIFDLKIAKYRVFDWLAMRVNGRRSGEDASSYEGDKLATRVLAHSFIKSGGVPSKFIQDLRETDYDIDTSYESIELTK